MCQRTPPVFATTNLIFNIAKAIIVSEFRERASGRGRVFSADRSAGWA
jgi:hypothetical protein